MEKNKLILMIVGILISFVLISYIASSFCNPSKNSQIGAFIEKNVPKPDNETINGLRRLWTLYFKKFCSGANNQSF